MLTHLFEIFGLISLFSFASTTVIPRQACGPLWSQCGGLEYTGTTCCTSGTTCVAIDTYYSQCQSLTPTSGGTTPTPTFTAPTLYTTTTPVGISTHTQSPYPAPTIDTCGAWTLVDNVCCPSYCSTDNRSESCSSSCTGECVTPPSTMCKSGTMYPEIHSVSSSESWHFSRSTHFGLTSGGACGFGLYGLCTRGSKMASWTDTWLADTCTAFCNAYPILCQDPADTELTLRGNFAAPNGDYYTQFWPSLPGDYDNYLSCGECMELIRTKPDGTDYLPSEAGYTVPIILEILDSCPCDANSKWCCGSGADHCGEIDFKYGCPLPADSIHLDLSDIAMGRLQGNGSLTDGVIPTRYKRVPCPTPGNIYLWLRDGGGPYYFALTIVNTAGIGSVISIEVQGYGTTEWIGLIHDPNYTESRPQERYGSWTLPQGKGPVNTPVAVRITSPTGEQVVAMEGIRSWTPPAGAVSGFWYIDLGVQFSA